MGTRLRRIVFLCALPLFSWLVLDLAYSLLIKARQASWEASICRDTDGVRTGCREFTVGDGDTAILLIHGFGDSPAVFEKLAPALADKGFACRAMRLPYFATRLDDYERTSLKQWRTALNQELQELRERHPRVVLLGHSLGGALALDHLATAGSDVDAAVLLAPLVEARSPLLPAHMWFELLDHLFLFTDSVGLLSPGDWQEQQARGFVPTEAFMPRGVIRDTLDLIGQNRPRAAAVSTPLLMVLAGNDAVVDNEAAEQFFGDCRSSFKRLRYREAARHVLPLEPGWQSLAGDIAAFVAELPRQSKSPGPQAIAHASGSVRSLTSGTQEPAACRRIGLEELQ